MSKRRRERDRPKAAPSGPYNPNKRVLLSYASDEKSPNEHESESTNGNAVTLPAVDYNGRKEHNDAALVVSDPSSAHHVAPAGQEDNEVEHGNEDTQRSRRKNCSREHHHARRNDATGQMAALGSLSYQWEDEEAEYSDEYDDEADEAMAYLRAVRSERQNMPVVLRAALSNHEDDSNEGGMVDTRGYFEDGAYVASANFGPHQPTIAKSDVDPQEAYTLMLKQRFLKHHNSMHVPIESSTPPAPEGKHLISFSAQRKKAKAGWLGLLQKTVPVPAQIQALTQEDALNLLDFARSNCFARGVEIAPNLSIWLWSLLARLDDVGSMNNDQVSVIRELGKMAILVQLSFTDPSTADQLAQNAAEEIIEDIAIREAGDDEHTSLVAEEISPVAGATSNEIHSSTARQNTMVTLDTIIVVVGDVFRQRDLLEFRQSWLDSFEASPIAEA